MGGYGSGRRWHLDAKATTGQFITLDVRRLKSSGLLVPGRSILWGWNTGSKNEQSIRIEVLHRQIILSYRASHIPGGESRSVSQTVALDWSPCHIGGARPWFICPSSSCGRRIAILYFRSVFLCRHCQRLSYGCQRENKSYRLARKVDKIRSRLGWEQGVLNKPNKKKPKGMHWRTFDSISAQHDILLDRSLRAILASMPVISLEYQD